MSVVDRLVERLNENFRAIAKASGVAHHPGPIEWFMSVPRGGVERIFGVTLSDGDARREIANLVSEIEQGAAPDAILLTPKSTPAGLEEVLSSAGFALLPESHWAHAMAMDLTKAAWLPEARDALPSGSHVQVPVELVRVEDSGGFGEWVTFVNRVLFRTELMKKADFVNMLDLPNVEFYTGYLAGAPAFATVSVHDGQSAGFELTTVDKNLSHEDLLIRFMGQVLRQLRDRGIRMAAVFSHPDDCGEYAKLGFSTHFRIKVYEYGRRSAVT